MKAFSLSIALICASSMYAGKKHRAEKLAAAIAASNAASAAAKIGTSASSSKTSSKCTVNCPGPANGGCWGCNPLEQRQQGQYDKK